MAKKKIYLIGSLRSSRVPKLANELRKLGYEVFDDWYSAGPEADDYWRKYERKRERTYKQALNGHAARHVYYFDKKHLDACEIAILCLPAGRSGHLELGYVLGKGKIGIILIDNPKRWDVMYQFARDERTQELRICESFNELKQMLKKLKRGKTKVKNK